MRRSMDLFDRMKLCFLNGAEKLLMSRNRSPMLLNFFDHSETQYTIVRPRPNILFSFPLLILRAITFKIDMLSTAFTIPIWVSYYTAMFIISPSHALSILKQGVRNRLIRTAYHLRDFTAAGNSNSVVTAAARISNGGRSVVRYVGWALLSVAYVGFVLVGLLVGGFLIGSLIVGCLVQGPIQFGKQSLRFDYTEVSPSAVVPIMPCAAAAVVDETCLSNIVARNRNHKLRLIVSLVLPESEFNMNLGVFQVRVEFVSANGSITGSSSHPCMMKYKSRIIQSTETLLKMVPILLGFESEAQVLTVPFKDFTSESHLKQSDYLKVVLLHRAEFLTAGGAGVPHVYTADIAVESELPPFKRRLWYWRRTIYVWVSSVLFLMELGYVMVFFRALLIPGGTKPNLRLLRLGRN